jgi:hypothetical protein
MAVEIKALKCPSCGAGLPLSNGKAACDYCGNEYLVSGMDITPVMSEEMLRFRLEEFQRMLHETDAPRSVISDSVIHIGADGKARLFDAQRLGEHWITSTNPGYSQMFKWFGILTVVAMVGVLAFIGLKLL